MTEATETLRAATPLAHAIVGPPDAAVVLVLGGISATRHVAGSASGDEAGWWSEIAGPGRTLDTDRRRLLSVEYVDGGERRDGRPAAIVTTHDQADAIVRLLDTLGIERLDAVVGASYGGMVALALGERWPARVGRAVVISAAHESTAMSTALRAIQRRIVELGLDAARPHEAMILARALAMTTYRTAAELASRFDVTAQVGTDGARTFDVERYLLHAAERYATRTPPSRFLALSLSSDLHRVVPEQVDVPTTVIAAAGDTLVPAEQTAELARRLPRLAGHITIPSDIGHDAFLAEPDRLAPLLTSALAD